MIRGSSKDCAGTDKEKLSDLRDKTWRDKMVIKKVNTTEEISQGNSV